MNVRTQNKEEVNKKAKAYSQCMFITRLNSLNIEAQKKERKEAQEKKNGNVERTLFFSTVL